MTFDPEVRVGEVRVFADLAEPLVAAVVETRGLAGSRIVPVSPYRVPANACELAIGERVFQLWNACTMVRRLVARSWVADVLDEADVARLRDGAATARLTKLGDYERRQLAVGGDFQPWASRLPRLERKSWWRYGSWSVAASVVIGLGVSWLALHEKPTEQPAPHVITVRMERANVVEPLEEMPCEAAEADGICAAAEKKAKVEIAVDLPKAAAPETAPKVHKLAAAPRMAEPVRTRAMQEAKAKRRIGKPDAVVAAKKSAGTREAEVRQTFAWLKTTQRADGSWGEKPLKDTALAVLALMAHGETVASPNYGQTLLKGVQYLSAAKLKGQSRQDIQIAACALCGASFAVPNPNVRTAAEAALKSIGDNRSVEAGRDWRGLLVDLATPVAPSTSRGAKVAAARSEKDEVADACVLVLRLLAE